MARGSDVLFSTEYVKNVLQFVVVRQGKSIANTKDIHCFCIDDEYVYENYYSDFGPLNLGCVYRYCELVNDKLKQYLNKKIIIHYTSIDPKKRANAAFLLGCFGVLYLNLSPREALRPLISHGMSYKPFQDAIMGDSLYTISLLDCFCAIKKARELQFFNFKDFDYKEYDLLNRIHGGDLNWIVPEKFLAFIGPVDANHSITIFHPPEMYIDYFLENNVKIVIRLNKSMYDESVFVKAGITHYTLYFQDGGVPPKHILKRFLQISEEAKCAIAVHCKAGLGRTGSLIGSYLIKHYRMNAREAIGWMRICRPGSVIGHQQGWLEEMEPALLKEGAVYRKRMQRNRDHSPEHRHGVYSIARKAKTYPTMILKKPVEDPLPPFEKVIIPNNYNKVIRPHSPKQREALNKNIEKETIEWRMKKSTSKTRLKPEKNTLIRGGGDLRQPNSKIGTKQNSPFSSVTYTFDSKRSSACHSPTRESEREPSILIKNMHDAGRFLMSPYHDQKINYLNSAISVKPQHINNVVPITHHKTVPIVSPSNNSQTTHFSLRSPNPMQQNRRRLGRSPSPPQVRSEQKKPMLPNNPLSRDPSPRKSDFIKEFNALKEKAQKIKRDSDTILKEALSRLKLQLPRDSRTAASSFGAGSLGTARTKGPRPRDAPSTRSDERPLATQGDLLNSIKYQRRLRDIMMTDKSNVKSIDSRGISDISDLPLIAKRNDPKYLNIVPVEPLSKPVNLDKPVTVQRLSNFSRSPDRMAYMNTNPNPIGRLIVNTKLRNRSPSPPDIKRTVHRF